MLWDKKDDDPPLHSLSHVVSIVYSVAQITFIAGKQLPCWNPVFLSWLSSPTATEAGLFAPTNRVESEVGQCVLYYPPLMIYHQLLYSVYFLSFHRILHDEYIIVIPSSLRRNPLRTPQLMVKFPEGTNAANANLLLISPSFFHTHGRRQQFLDKKSGHIC